MRNLHDLSMGVLSARLRNIFSRADTSALQSVLGTPTTNLLAALGGVTTPAKIVDALSDMYSQYDLLLSRDTRKLIVQLLRPDEAAELASELGIPPTGSVYSDLSKAKLTVRSSSLPVWLRYFGVQTSPLSPTSNLDHYVRSVPRFKLFAHQRKAVHRVREAFAKGNRTLLHMPTGAGKTRVAMNVVSLHLRQHEPTVVLWLCASEELCEQAVEEFCRAWDHQGDRDVGVLRWWGQGGGEISKLQGDGFIVGSFSKAYAAAVKDVPFLASLGDVTSLVVVDEAHQAIAPTYRHVIDSVVFRNSTTRLLGLTATPGRSWDDRVADEALAEYFHRSKVTLEIEGYSSPVDYLIEQGYLARPSFRTLTLPGPTLSSFEVSRLNAEFEIPSFVLERLALDDVRNICILKETERLASAHKRILVFSPTVSHAKMLAAVLRVRGHAAACVTATTPISQRHASIEWYLEDVANETRILTNYGVLTTGFDAPKTSAILIARPTRSLVLYSQMVGRATRGVLAGGNLTAEVVTVVDTSLPGFGDIAASFGNWEDIW